MTKYIKIVYITILLLLIDSFVYADTYRVFVDGVEYREGDMIASAGETILQCPADYAQTVPLMALKDENGRVFHTERGEWQAGSNHCRAAFSLPADLSDCTVSFYFWDDMNGLKPYAGSWGFRADNTVTESKSKYSDVYLSSRWYRTDGQDGQLGTLDALKRFMATGEKWGYITGTTQIEAIKNMGLTFQNAVNINVGDDATTRAELFDGTLAQAPWMTWGAKWSCVNKPAYREMVWQQLRVSIDAGVTEIQFDDWAANVSAVSWGGCFCAECRSGFRSYLKENLTEEQYAGYGITDIATFDYKAFLTEKYAIATNEEYLRIMTAEPLYRYFVDFQLQSTRRFHSETKQMMEEYTSQPLHYDHNVPSFGSIFDNQTRVFAYDIFDGGIGETKTADMELSAVLASGYLSSSMGKPFIYSPIPEDDNMPLIRKTVALCYANGQNILVPWDVWIKDNVRYFATVDEIGDLFHFVRQYPYLFDDYEVPAKVGVLVNLDECTSAQVRRLTLELFRTSVPFRLIVSKQELPYFEFSEADLQGLDYLIAWSDISSLRPKEQQAVQQSGVQLIQAGELPEHLYAAQVDRSNVYAALREKENSRVIHLLNRGESAASNLQVTLKENILYGAETQVFYYTPGENPRLIPLELTADGACVLIDNLYEWGILLLLPAEACALSEDGWSGMAIGTKTIPSDTAVMQNGKAEIVSHGFGLGGQTEGDKAGTQDRTGFVYRNIGKKEYRSFSLQARIQDAEGTAGIMVREYPSSNARFVAAEPVTGGIKLSWRSNDNAPMETQLLAVSGAPEWIRLMFDAEGGRYICGVSSDGGTWQELSASIPLRLTQKLAGVYGASLTGKGEYAAFTDVAVKQGEYAAQARPIAVKVTAPEQVEKGQTGLLSVAVTTAGGVLEAEQFDMVYQSDNPNILAVDRAGFLTALQPGDATIMVTAAAGSYQASASVKINVLPRNLLLAEADFENGIPDDWSYTENSANGGYIRVEPEEGRGNVLSIYDNVTSDNISVSKKLRVTTTEPVVAEFDFKTVSEPDAASKGAIVFYTYDSAGGFATSLLTNGKSFYVMENGASTIVCNMLENVWYHIKLEMQLPQCRQVVTISNADGVVVQKEFGFRNSAMDLASISIGGNVAAVGTYSYWDNITVKIAE